MDFDEVFIIDMGFIKLSKFKKKNWWFWNKIFDFDIKYFDFDL